MLRAVAARIARATDFMPVRTMVSAASSSAGSISSCGRDSRSTSWRQRTVRSCASATGWVITVLRRSSKRTCLHSPRRLLRPSLAGCALRHDRGSWVNHPNLGREKGRRISRSDAPNFAIGFEQAVRPFAPHRPATAWRPAPGHRRPRSSAAVAPALSPAHASDMPRRRLARSLSTPPLGQRHAEQLGRLGIVAIAIIGFASGHRLLGIGGSLGRRRRGRKRSAIALRAGRWPANRAGRSVARSC